MEYRLELHSHTSVVTPTSTLDPRELVAHGEDFGLDAVCVTDVLNAEELLRDDAFRRKSRQEIVAWVSTGYRAAREVAGTTSILFGIEHRPAGWEHDLLLVGLPPER